MESPYLSRAPENPMSIFPYTELMVQLFANKFKNYLLIQKQCVTHNVKKHPDLPEAPQISVGLKQFSGKNARDAVTRKLA